MIDVQFPENKLELLPAGFIFLVFVLLAWLTVKFLKKYHVKEVAKAKAIEAKLQQQNASPHHIEKP
ncbi:hypothetical protein A374_03664 [Fictibacillus macauensis ZFHKF-1]|uniref:Uncharacterized protein n=1 Tax=Fictibacillus macauensis ZFHKF-1 TaxID=1196324 RepID=I8AL83_9BACL|nr:hypothetical protein [Fictibacillus macauensis]EIT86637.1 hypothetical protein A374_03664 [Fictibacillus macauensis ZFHKF-1]